MRFSYVIGTAFGGSPEGIYANREIWPGDVVETVKMLLLMPARTLVSRVEVQPSKPPQPGPKR